MSEKSLALAVLLAATGCVTTSAGTSAVAASAAPGSQQETLGGTPARAGANQEVVCFYEKTTGSNIREKVCRTKTTRERDQENAKQMLEGTARVGAPSTRGGGL